MKLLSILSALVLLCSYPPTQQDGELLRFDVSICQDFSDCPSYPKMLEFFEYADTIKIVIRAHENCVFGDSSEVVGFSKLIGDSMIVGISQRLTRINEAGDTIMREAIPNFACECTFLFEYTIAMEAWEDYAIYYRGDGFNFWENNRLNHRPPTFDIVAGDTVNRYDKFGFRQGYHNHESLKKDFSSKSAKDYAVFNHNRLMEYCLHDSLGNITSQQVYHETPCH